jgi:hypothetical protein
MMIREYDTLVADDGFCEIFHLATIGQKSGIAANLLQKSEERSGVLHGVFYILALCHVSFPP